MSKTLIVITGPTGVGKTAAAIKLAQHLQCDIINADSRQIYRGIPICTAAPTPEELAAPKLHAVLKDPNVLPMVYGGKGEQSTPLTNENETAMAAPAPAQEEKPRSRGFKYHKVQPGETVFTLAKKFNMTVEEFQRMNNLGNSTKVRVGQLMIHS